MADDYGDSLVTPNWITSAPDAGKELQIGEEGGAGDIVNRASKAIFGYVQQVVSGAIGQNLLPNSDFRTWSAGASAAPDGWTLQGGGSVARSTDEKRGIYATEITYSGSDTYLESDSEPAYIYFQGNEVTVGFWVKTSTAAIARIIIDDGVGTSASGYHTGGGTYELLEVTRTLDGSASKLTVELHVEGAGSAKFDAGKMEEGEVATAFSPNSKVVQVVNFQTGAVDTGATALPADDSIPQQSGPQEGDKYMELAITPTNANNKLRINVVIFLAHSSVSTNNLTAALFQDSTAPALAAGVESMNVINRVYGISFTHYMTAGTIAETTFKVHGGGDIGATTTFNGIAGGRLMGGVMASSITITEYAP